MLDKKRVVLSAILIVLMVGTLVVLHTYSSTGNSTGTLQTQDPTYPPYFIDHLPFTINESGIYYLAEDLTVNGTGITILANDTVLNGLGHTITGDGTGQGIDLRMSGAFISNFRISGFYKGINYNVGTVDRSTICDNIICDNYIGIYLLRDNSAQQVTIRSNYVSNSTRYGIAISDCTNDFIYDNILCNPNHNAYDDDNNAWNLGYFPGTNIVGGPLLGGNYWTNPNGNGYSDTCADADKDGFGDTPYNIYGGSAYDNLPLVDLNPPEYVLTPVEATLPNVSLNVTWVDAFNVQVSKAILELDGVNYTDIARLSESLGFSGSNGSWSSPFQDVVSYSKVFTGLTPGIHYYKWYANDTRNNWNSTDLLSFNVTAVPQINDVSLSPILEITANITCGGVSNITQDLDYVGLHFKIDDNWFAMNMSFNSTTQQYSALIPVYNELGNKTIQYCVEVVDHLGNRVTSDTYTYNVPDWVRADLNRDGIVNMKDIGFAARHFLEPHP